jgi:SynChlorMet cassette radical SAM/SPASM protein ScmE
MTASGNAQASAVMQPPAVMATPRSLDVEITSRCNLRCRYCYYFDNAGVDYHDLPTSAWLRFFEECGDAQVMDLSIAGGEPFMRKDLRTLLDGVVRNRMRFSLLSNGGLITDAMAGYLAATGRCDSVQISIDGSRAEVHDTLRGSGSFDRAVAGLRTLQRNGVSVAVRVTIHRHNVDDLENTTRFLLEDLGLRGFSTNSAGALGSCKDTLDDVALTTVQREQAMATLLWLAERYDGRISANAGPLAEARAWRRMEEARASGAPAFASGASLTGCGCHTSKLAVRADGAYIICAMLPHEVLGTINQDRLVDVWQRSPSLERMRNRHRIPLTTFSDCADCAYAPYCTGNCPALAYSGAGSTERPSPDTCLRRFLEAGGRIPAFDPEPAHTAAEIPA